VVRWGYVFASSHGLHCSYHKVNQRSQIARDEAKLFVLSNVGVAVCFRSPRLRVPSSQSQGRTGAHRSPNAPASNPWRAARQSLQTAGGQCRHSGNSLIRFRSPGLSSQPSYVSLCKAASKLQTHPHPLLSAFHLPFPPSSSRIRRYKIQSNPVQAPNTIALLVLAAPHSRAPLGQGKKKDRCGCA
jgi:hypothetical protein